MIISSGWPSRIVYRIVTVSDTQFSPPPETPVTPTSTRALAVVALSLCSAGLAPASPAAATAALGYDAANKGALHHIGKVVGAHDAFAAGLTGKGVGIALIDTGVTEVPGLDSGNVYHGPDLSFDSQDPELTYKDGYGHGTHMASIMVGRDAPGHPMTYTDTSKFFGIAPDATLVSIKVGAQDGAVDVSQVIAAINWVVENRNAGPDPIRVINLSYGTDSEQDYAVDPLVHAAENAWRKGITVVAAAGNDGRDTMLLANPALSPNLLAVGAEDTAGTVDVGDDVVPEFASRGTDKRHVDVVAPGVSVLGLRVPGGYADELHPEARVGDRFARASGTSQAAAVVSAQVALLQQKHSGRLTPDQVKTQFMSYAHGLDLSKKYSGRGLTKVNDAVAKPALKGKASGLPFSTGTGSLEAARGSSHVSDGGGGLQGEFDIFGRPWDAYASAAAADGEDIWQGRTWRGATWTGDGWNGRTWRGADWSADSFTAGTWSGRTWRDDAWAGRTWREGTWTGRTWRDGAWAGRTWRLADLASDGWR